MKNQRTTTSLWKPSWMAALRIGLIAAVLALTARSITRSDGLVVWSKGQTLTAADLNSNFAAVDARLMILESGSAKVSAWESVACTMLVGGTPATNATVNAWQRRVGDTAEIRLEVLTATSPMNGANILSGEITWTLPQGIVMDMTRGPRGVVGVVDISSTVFENYLCHAVIISEGDQIYGYCNSSGSGSSTRISTSSPVTFAGQEVSAEIDIRLPVKGWTLNTP